MTNLDKAIIKHAVSYKNTPMPSVSAIELGMQKIAYRNEMLAYYAKELNCDITTQVRKLAETAVNIKFK